MPHSLSSILPDMSNLAGVHPSRNPPGPTCGCAAAKGGGRGDGRGDGRGEVAAGVARRGGDVAPGQAARQGQGQLGLRLLLHRLVLTPRRLRHEPGGGSGGVGGAGLW